MKNIKEMEEDIIDEALSEALNKRGMIKLTQQKMIEKFDEFIKLLKENLKENNYVGGKTIPHWIEDKIDKQYNKFIKRLKENERQKEKNN
jgi:hypothetical protein